MANTLKIKRGTAATIPQGQLAEPLFTTDTYDLYIGKGSGGNQRIQNYIASGTSSQFLKGDGSLDSTTYQATSEKGQNNGYASLDSGGKVPVAQLPNSIMDYKGTWDASTNTPTLADGTGNAGDVYICSVGGTQNLGSGSITFAAGDWVVYSGSVWQKSINSNAVASVNGQTGAVVLYTDDISEDGSPTNLWFTDSRARLALSATSPVQYNNSTGVISILDASASQSGVVTTGTQTFAGAKTFSSDLTINSLTAGRGGGGESTSTAFGNTALFSNTYNSTSLANTAIGYRALYSNAGSASDGSTNTAVGADALYANTTGSSNVAIGVNAGKNIIGSNNTFLGTSTFFTATSGSGNTVIGYNSGLSFTSGSFNTLIGYNTGGSYTSGSNNTIIGRFAGSATTISGNVIIADGSGNVRFQHDGTNGKLPFLTSNGFVKTSNSDGTLSVDTNTYLTTSSASSTYLPLTGGTLTGALSGTSATFSGNVGVGATLNTWNTNYKAVQIGIGGALTGRTDSGLEMQWLGNAYRDTSGNYIYTTTNKAARIVIDGDASFGFYQAASGTAGGIITWTSPFTISSTGAATFSSSIAATSATFSSLTNTYILKAGASGLISNSSIKEVSTGYVAIVGSGTGNTNTSFISFRDSTDTEVGWVGDGASGNADIYLSTTNNLRLVGSTIIATGAATFSSSVTATSAAFNTSVIIGNVTSLTGAWGNLTSVLQLGNTTTDKGYISVNEISGDDDINIVRYAYFDNTNWKRIGGGNPSRYYQRNAEHCFQYASSGADNTTITWNNTLYISNGGNVGIGTTSPGSYYSTKLVVSVGGEDGITIAGVNNNYLMFADGTTGADRYRGYVQYSHTSDYMAFATDATERMRITSGGEVYIAGTTDQGAYNLQCNGTGVWGAGAYVNGSDIALKENIKPILSGLDFVSKMKPVSYNYIQSYSKDRSLQTGFIAQDLIDVFAGQEWIEGIVKKGNEHYNVAYQNLIPILTKAIQELKAELDTLKNINNN